MEKLIQIRDVSYVYQPENAGPPRGLNPVHGPDAVNEPGNPVIKGISLEVNKGEFVGIVGPNGCGKSTLVRLINGLLLPSRGLVLVDGLNTRDEGNLPLIRKKVGMVFQNPDTQLFASVVEEDVAFGVENLCLSREEIRARVEQALEWVGMAEYRDYPPHRLSGGQKQKVAIAGILAMQPECIVLDEPASMLDPRSRNEVMEAVRLLNTREKIAVLYVTHDMAEVMDCDRLVALVEGGIIFNGRPDKFFADPAILKRAGLKPPPIKELVNRLESEGLRLGGSANSAEELVEAICRYS